MSRQYPRFKEGIGPEAIKFLACVRSYEKANLSRIGDTGRSGEKMTRDLVDHTKRLGLSSK